MFALVGQIKDWKNTFIYIKYFKLYYYRVKFGNHFLSSFLGKILSFRSLETLQKGNRYHTSHPTSSTIVCSRRHYDGFSFFVADLNEVNSFSANLISRRTVRSVRNLSTLKNGMNEFDWFTALHIPFPPKKTRPVVMVRTRFAPYLGLLLL